MNVCIAHFYRVHFILEEFLTYRYVKLCGKQDLDKKILVLDKSFKKRSPICMNHVLCLLLTHLWSLIRKIIQLCKHIHVWVPVRVLQLYTTFINGGTWYYPFVFMLIRPTGLTLVETFFWIVPMAARLIRLISIKTKEYQIWLPLWKRSMKDTLVMGNFSYKLHCSKHKSFAWQVSLCSFLCKTRKLVYFLYYRKINITQSSISSTCAIKRTTAFHSQIELKMPCVAITLSSSW